MKKVLAIDMGATSIRAIIGYIENNKLVTEEVMRYSHNILDVDGRKQWDFANIIKKIEETIIAYKDKISSIGVDTWGVDFGLLDKNGRLIYNPTSYRDESNVIGIKAIKEKIDFEELYLETGNQIMEINTLFQLETLKMNHNSYYKKGSDLLMMPDLINYILTGNKYGERSICSTSQMFDLNKGEWNRNLLSRLGINCALLPKLIDNKVKIGTTKNSLLESLRSLDIEVISVASHDTASAVYVTESYTDSNCLFLSSGTWSLIGVCTDKAIISEKSYKYSLTNETGYNNKNMFFKNVTGLYLIEKLRSQLAKDDPSKYSFDRIGDYVRNTDIKESILIDVDYDIFTKESNDFVGDLDTYIKDKYNIVIEDKKDYFKVIYQSIVANYKEVVKNIEDCLGKKFKKIHVIGGGSQSEILCEMITKALDIELIAGPKEATAVGNILSQLEYIGEYQNIREKVINGFETLRYLPNK